MFSSPVGPGSLQVNLSWPQPWAGTFCLAVTLSPPPGWFFGINIGVQELADEINAGPPVLRTAESGHGLRGRRRQRPRSDRSPALPSGLTVYAVGLGLAGGGLQGPVTIGEVTPAGAYTIP